MKLIAYLLQILIEIMDMAKLKYYIFNFNSKI